MANFQSVMKSPLVSDMLTMHVMVGRHDVIISFNISVLISFAAFVFHTHYFSFDFVVCEWCKTCKCWCICFFQMVLWGACKPLSYFGYFV